LALLYGPPGVGKSFLALDWSLCIAAGLGWHGLKVKKGLVIYVAGEGHAGLRIRVPAWKQLNEFSGESGARYVNAAVIVSRREELSAFLAVAAPAAPILVVIDTLARCMVGGDEDSAKDMGLFVEATDQIRRAGATVLVLHHPTKNKAVPRGSSALTGAADTVLYLRAARGVLRLDCEKQKDGAPFESVSLRLVPVALQDGRASCAIGPADGAVPPKPLFNRDALALLRALAGATDQSVRVAELRQLVRGSESTFHRMSRELANQGLIDVGVRGVYTLTEQGAVTVTNCQRTVMTG
jgi:hypothetical protein